MLLVALLHCTVCVSREIVFGHGISAVRIASVSPHPPSLTQPRKYFSHNILEGCFEYINHYCTMCLLMKNVPYWWNHWTVHGFVFFPGKWSVVCLPAAGLKQCGPSCVIAWLCNGAERELLGRQRHRRTRSGVSVSIIMYVAFVPKCGSVKNLGTSVRKENSNSCRFYGNNSTWGMFAEVKFSALSTNLRTVVYTDMMLRVRKRTDWVCWRERVDQCYKG